MLFISESILNPGALNAALVTEVAFWQWLEAGVLKENQYR